ncbi:hypothetical protein BH23PLA1_BH23PLA1_09110 [soil metagenome]
MRSLILQKIAQAVFPVTLLFAVYLLLRGHNLPGGGFIAGLVISTTIVLEALAFGAEVSRLQYTSRLRPLVWVGMGLAVATAFLPAVLGDPFFTHYHAMIEGPNGVEFDLSTTLLFDIGVLLVVIGTVATALAVFLEPERSEVES